MRAVIDTNVLIYDTFEDSIYHLEEKRLLDSLDEWILPAIVIHEYVWAMKSLNVDATTTLEKVEEYVEHHKSRLIGEVENDILFALSTIVEEGLSTSRYNDKVVLSIAVKGKYTLATFDGRLRNQALAAGLEVLPISHRL